MNQQGWWAPSQAVVPQAVPDESTLVCGADNRPAEDGWTVHVRNGTAEWAPPPHLDTGQTRTNFYQRLLLRGDGDPESEGRAG